mmetsp:Transcript_3359/g.8315  ORF Transcript_3359/g.8315 Transcript_3359/m.8315 type:complete len:102 (-) Transcript_3359:8-313(-)
MKSGGEAGGETNPQLQMVACDANVHPMVAAQTVVALKPLQASQCWVLLSLKNFCGKRAKWERSIREVVDLLEGEGFECRVRHLFANAPMEKCLIARGRKTD